MWNLHIYTNALLIHVFSWTKREGWMFLVCCVWKSGTASRQVSAVTSSGFAHRPPLKSCEKLLAKNQYIPFSRLSFSNYVVSTGMNKLQCLSFWKENLLIILKCATDCEEPVYCTVYKNKLLHFPLPLKMSGGITALCKCWCRYEWDNLFNIVIQHAHVCQLYMLERQCLAVVTLWSPWMDYTASHCMSVYVGLFLDQPV